MVVTADTAYLLTDTTLSALRRSDKREVWRQTVSYPYSLILAGSTLFAGGDGEIAAFEAATGSKAWSADVRGKAYGLAVSGGRLFVSTDEGLIHIFVEDPFPGPGLQRPGDFDQDSKVDLSDAVSLLRRLFLGFATLPCVGDSVAIGSHLALYDINGDNDVDISDGVFLLVYLFRGGAPPAMGVDCVSIPGCPNICVP